MLNKFKNQVVAMMKEEKGQGMVEYALIIAFVAVVVIAVLVLMGPAIVAKFQEIINALN